MVLPLIHVATVCRCGRAWLFLTAPDRYHCPFRVSQIFVYFLNSWIEYELYCYCTTATHYVHKYCTISPAINGLVLPFCTQMGGLEYWFQTSLNSELLHLLGEYTLPPSSVVTPLNTHHKLLSCYPPPFQPHPHHLLVTPLPPVLDETWVSTCMWCCMHECRTT